MVDVKQIGRWGANSAIRLNGTALSKTGINEGDKVTVEYLDGKIVIKKLKEQEVTK